MGWVLARHTYTHSAIFIDIYDGGEFTAPELPDKSILSDKQSNQLTMTWLWNMSNVISQTEPLYDTQHSQSFADILNLVPLQTL